MLHDFLGEEQEDPACLWIQQVNTEGGHRNIKVSIWIRNQLYLMFLNSKLILLSRWPTSRTSASLSSPRLRRLGSKSMSAWARLWSVRGSKGSEDLYVCLQVTRDLFDRVLEGSTFKIGPNPKIFLRRVFPVQVWPERFIFCVCENMWPFLSTPY